MKNSNSSSHRNLNIPIRSLLQKVHGVPKPVREYKRFSRSKIGDIGEDPNGAILEFIKNDIIRPLERTKTPSETFKVENQKWTIGTTKQCASIDKVPKLQTFKDYYFPQKRNDEKIEKYKSHFPETDDIALRVPKIKNLENNESFLNLKKKFGCHTETFKDGWFPKGNAKTMNNRSSVTYNIVTNDNNSTSGLIVLKIMDKKLANKKKGIAEFEDLAQPFNSKINKNYVKLHEENKNIFKVYNGIFSHMYDAARRNGNIVVPFRNNDATGQNIPRTNSRNSSPYKINASPLKLK